MGIKNINKSLQEKAIHELHEDPKRIPSDIIHIKEWLKKQTHLIVYQDDEWLLNFLRSSKFSLEKTKAKIDKFYTMRTATPEYFSNRDPMLPEIQRILKKQMVFLLPKTATWDGPTTLICRPCLFDPNTMNPRDFMKVLFMTFDIFLNENVNSMINGLTVLADCKGITMNQLAYFTPSILKTTVDLFQESYPIRPKALHIVNMPSVMRSFFNMVRMLMKEKLRERVHGHSEDLSSLYDSVSQSILPDEWGGNAGTTEQLSDGWRRKIESYQVWFQQQEKYCTNEKKRLIDSKRVINHIQIQGSFRKLDID